MHCTLQKLNCLKTKTITLLYFGQDPVWHLIICATKMLMLIKLFLAFLGVTMSPSGHQAFLFSDKIAIFQENSYFLLFFWPFCL